ncbi:MAG: acetylglutamate kinase [Bacteroidetes bacterium]|jgi:acetylglutamate kinase|nr:acetylglutamate kinase [Bacteroidota bacterium]
MPTNASAAPVVVKLGGSLLQHEQTLAAFWPQLVRLQQSQPVVLVHGGGPQTSALSRRLGREPEKVEGRRITGDADLQALLWAVRGELSTQLVAAARRQGLQAVGLSGVDGGLIEVKRRPPWTVNGREVDFGHVGDICRVDPVVVQHLLERGMLPVVAPLGVDAEGQVYNVNADTIARALAEALEAKALLFATETGGVHRSPGADGASLKTCSATTAATGTSEGWICGGMKVKVDMALEALRAGVSEVCIVHAADLVERQRATHVTL